MPSHYAHYRFGKELFPELPPQAKQCVQRFRRLYDMGLQGPDFFFFYNPLWDTAVGQLGSRFHMQSGQEFFPRVCAQADTEAARAYLYGLLGHYCLDSICHPYVNKVNDSGEAPHIILEKEFDRYLMALDNLPDPASQDLSDKVKLTRGECVTVAGFYPPATPGQVNAGVRHMAWSIRFLADKNREKREKLVRRVSASLLQHFIPAEGDPALSRMDSELLARYNRAKKTYLVMLAQITAHREAGAELGEEFVPNFG